MFDERISEQINYNLHQAQLKGCFFVVYSLPGTSDVKLSFGKEADSGDNPLRAETFIVQSFNRNLPSLHIQLEPILDDKQSLRFKNEMDYGLKYASQYLVSDKTTYLNRLENLLQDMRVAQLKKVVLSRRKLKKLSKPLDIGKIFGSLQTKYPKSFNYILRFPDGNCWIGSSPELLLKKQENNFETVSLAATKKITDVYDWSEKEITEQKLVTDYIVDTLKPVSQTLSISKAEESISGHIKHLKTRINFTSALSFLEIAKRLHPTPAVAGLPCTLAIEWLEKNEGYNRKLYTGFLGILDKNGNGLAHVNLRCMELFQSEAILYLGGGILPDSVPLSEWVETEDKAGILESVILDASHLETYDNN